MAERKKERLGEGERWEGRLDVEFKDSLVYTELLSY